MLEFLQHVVNGITFGSIYALIALGYTLVYGILSLINFAHGDVYMVGAFTGFYGARLLGLDRHPSLTSLVIAIALSMSVCALVGALIERVCYRPLRDSPRLNALITAIGVSLFLEYAVQLGAGPDPKLFPQIFSPGADFSVGGLKINGLQASVLVIAVLLMAALQLIIFKTRLGRAMRALSQDRTTASLMGIPVDRVITATFVIGSALAGAAGVLVGLIYPRVEPLMGVMPGLKAFVAAVLGGIGSAGGAVVGSMVLSLSEEFISGYGAPSYRDAIAFVILIVVLLVKPEGLLGRPRAEKV